MAQTVPIEATHIEQMLDTEVRISVNEAFSRVTIRFVNDRCKPFFVTLDLEAGIRLLTVMDGGKSVVEFLERHKPKPSNMFTRGQVLLISGLTLLALVVRDVIGMYVQ